MEIAVIGGAGRMGQWLTKHFNSLGHSVVISDPVGIEHDMSDKPGTVSRARNNISAVDGAEAVIISVPIEKTTDVIRQVAPHMREGAILCEISSVKGGTPDVLKRCIVNKIQPLCIHPMFGPGSRTQVKKILLLPIMDAESEQGVVMTLFPNAHVILTTQEEHDRAIALTISLPYFVNMALASVYVEEDIARLQRVGGTTFTMQLLLTSSVMSNDSCLHKSMHATNQHSMSILSRFESIFQKSLMTLTRDVTEFAESYKALQETMEHQVDLNEKYHEMNHILETMERLSTKEGGL